MQCYFLGSRKVCCMLVFNFSLFSNFCFACLKASQKSGLCSAFPSAPVESVTRFSQNFVLRVLPYKHRVCAVLFVRLPYSLLHAFVVSNLRFCTFCLTIIGLVQCFFLRLPSSLHPFFLCFIQFAFFMRALPNKLRPVVQRFFPVSPRICTLNFFALYYSVLILCSGPYSPSLI